MIGISHIPCYYGYSVVIATRVKPGNKQTPWIAVCLKELCTEHDTRRASNGKVTSKCLCYHGNNILILISKPFNCYGYLVTMVTKRYLYYSFVLSPIEFIFDMEVPEDNKHQPQTLLLWLLNCHGSQSETWQQATLRIAACLKELCTKYDTRRASNGKVTSKCLCCHGNNISISTSKPFNEIA